MRAHALAVAGLAATLLAPALSALAATTELGLFPGAVLDAATAGSATNDTQATPATITGPSLVMVAGILWSLTSVFLLARFIVGFRRGVMIARSATPCGDDHTRELLHRLWPTVDVELRRTDQLASPAVYCWRRPACVLLPPQVADDPTMLEPVLRHEIAHVVRRDHLWRLLAEMAACLLPWHPAVWSLRGAVYESSELACDAHVVEHGEPDHYAETLLQLAPCRRTHLPALHGMGARTRLTRRLHAILDPQPKRERLGRLGLAIIVTTCLAVSSLTALAQRSPVRMAPGVSFTAAELDASPVRAVPGELDLGVVAPGEAGAGTIRLVNLGSRPAHVTNVKPACGCTTIDGFQPRTLAPGDMMSVPIEMKAPDKVGAEYIRTVRFQFEDQEPLVVSLRLETPAS